MNLIRKIQRLRRFFSDTRIYIEESRNAHAQQLNELRLLRESSGRLLESLNGISRRTPPSFPVKVVFLVHHASSWIATLPVFKAMKDDRRFCPIAVSLPHYELFSGRDGLTGEEQIHDLLKTQLVQHLRITEQGERDCLQLLRQLNPDVVFKQTPWEHDCPAGLQTQNLAFTRICYIPYGYLTAAIEDKQFDQPFHRHCWKIFCPDDAHVNLFSAHSLKADQACVKTGYPKFDFLASRVKRLVTPSCEGFHLIWAPHYSFQGDWLRFGAFDEVAPQMLKLASSRSDVRITLRPHPALAEKINSCGQLHNLSEFMVKWNGLPNTGLSLEPDYSELFRESDALLTDGLSFLSEYQLFEKPLIFFERRDNVGFNSAGSCLLPGLYRVGTIDELDTTLSFITRRSENCSIREASKLVVDSIHTYPGRASVNIINAILAGLAVECPLWAQTVGAAS